MIKTCLNVVANLATAALVISLLIFLLWGEWLLAPVIDLFN